MATSGRRRAFRSLVQSKRSEIAKLKWHEYGDDQEKEYVEHSGFFVFVWQPLTVGHGQYVWALIPNGGRSPLASGKALNRHWARVQGKNALAKALVIKDLEIAKTKDIEIRKESDERPDQ